MYDKKKLAEYLRTVFAHTTSDSHRVRTGEPHSIIGGAGSRFELESETGQRVTGAMPTVGAPTLYVVGDGALALRDFIDECLKDRDFASQIGGKAVQNRLTDVLKERFGTPSDQLDFDAIVRADILKFLRAGVKSWRVQVPIASLELKTTFEIGRVRFVSHDEGVVANIQLICGNVGPSSDPIAANASKATVLHVVTQFAQKGTAWAIADIEAHENRIPDVTNEQVEGVINLIRAFTHVFYPRGLRTAFGLPYELTAASAGYVASSGPEFSIQTDMRGLHSKFELNDGVLTRLKQDFHFDRLSEIVARGWNELNSLERAIRVAIQWLGRSVIAKTNAESFTHCAIALERLLIVDGEETTVERFADRLAFLVSEDAGLRKEIHRAAKRLYDVRSRIVHAGFESVDDEQMDELEDLAINALVSVAAMAGDLPDHEALKSHLHDRKMD